MNAHRAPEGASAAGTAVLIPAYRERARIGPVIRRALGSVATVLVVDDGSDDGTGDAARAAGAELIVHRSNRGKGAALKTGMRALADRGFDWILLLDGDGQHDPDEIPRFLALRDAPHRILAVGNRMGDTARMPAVRRWVNRAMSGAISRLCGQPIPDSQCGFRMLPCEAVPVVDAPSNRFDYETEMLIYAARAGFRILPVEISTIYAGEKSKIHPVRDTLRFFRLLWRHRGGRAACRY
jgi:glycosyltransferase involved in cell wall biosynthesis